MNDWSDISTIPPNKLLEVSDERGVVFKAQPMYSQVKQNKYTKEVQTVEKTDWCGGWLIETRLPRERIKFGSVVKWREIKVE